MNRNWGVCWVKLCNAMVPITPIPTHPPRTCTCSCTCLRSFKQVAKEMEKHVGVAGRFMDALRAEVKKDMEKFAKK